MKKTVIVVAALVCLSPVPAMADDAALMLESTLRDRIAHLGEKVERKNDLLACERANRRELQRALREGDAAVVRACR